MKLINHSEELIYSSKQNPKNPESFINYFIKQLETKTLNIQSNKYEIFEKGPREKLFTKFEVLGMMNTEFIFSVRFDIKENKTDVYFGFEVDDSGVPGKLFRPIGFKSSVKRLDQLYTSLLTANIKKLVQKSINYTNSFIDPVLIQKKNDQVTDGGRILIFISYSTVDEPIYRIKQFAEELTNLPKIYDVLYWQEDMKDNIIEYMNNNLGKCDILVLFCSPNSLNSEPVMKEWTAAEAMNKPIIPIFKNPDHIPPLLKSRLGIQFDDFSFDENVKKIYELIMKKIQK